MHPDDMRPEEMDEQAGGQRDRHEDDQHQRMHQRWEAHLQGIVSQRVATCALAWAGRWKRSRDGKETGEGGDGTAAQWSCGPMRCLGLYQLAEQVEQHHFVDGAGNRAGDAGIGNDHRQTLSAGDGHVHPVAVEDEGQPARAIFAVTGTEGQDADRGFLPLKPVHAPDPRAARQGALKRADLGVVGGDEEKVFQRQGPRAAIFRCVQPPLQLLIDRLNPRDLFVALLDVAVVLDAAEDDAAFAGDEAGLRLTARRSSAGCSRDVTRDGPRRCSRK